MRKITATTGSSVFFDLYFRDNVTKKPVFLQGDQSVVGATVSIRLTRGDDRSVVLIGGTQIDYVLHNDGKLAVQIATLPDSVDIGDYSFFLELRVSGVGSEMDRIYHERVAMTVTPSLLDTYTYIGGAEVGYSFVSGTLDDALRAVSATGYGETMAQVSPAEGNVYTIYDESPVDIGPHFLVISVPIEKCIDLSNSFGQIAPVKLDFNDGASDYYAVEVARAACVSFNVKLTPKQ